MSIFVAEINDQLSGALWQHALQAMIGIQSLMKPKRFDKLIQRRTRDVRDDDHVFLPKVNFFQYGCSLKAQNELNERNIFYE